MKNWTEDTDIQMETKRLVLSHTLKRCILCGAVNALANTECFVCRWHGSFDTKPSEIEEGVQLLLNRCPELATAMIDATTQIRQRKSWLQNLAARFAALLRR